MKKKYYIIEPEVAGKLGKNTKRDTSVHPPIIHKLHYIIENWQGDDIIEAFPVYLISEKLKQLFINEDLQGYEIAECKITLSENFKELAKETEVPKFYWLKITGTLFYESDFYINDKNHLVVSGKVKDILENVNIKNCNRLKVYQNWEEYTVYSHEYEIELNKI